MKSTSAPKPAPTLVVRNSQRDRELNARTVRRLVSFVLSELRLTAELGLHFVSAKRMAKVNWEFLRHEGSTDVITFDHGSTPTHLHGELFVSVADAVVQAEEFQTAWPEEVARYLIHGILHLRGYDDRAPVQRRRMKREEERLVRAAAHAGFTNLAAGPAATRRTRCNSPSTAEPRPHPP